MRVSIAPVRKIPPILLFTTLVLFANIDDDTLTKMSFEELMAVEVSVASRKDESIYETPGMVTSYSYEEIQRLGYYTIGELADITPGYSSTYLFGERGFETRGLKSDAFNNNRHLVLFNGIPINHVRANKAPTQEEFPTLFVERVEFLRGPASALYGTGAYYGVINVVPETPEVEGSILRSRFAFGTEQLNRQLIASMATKTDKALFSVSASYYEKLPSESLYGVPGNENRLYWDDRLALSGVGTFELAQGPLTGFGLGMMYLSRETGLGEHWGDMSHELNDLKWTTYIFYLNYKKQITDQLSTMSYVKYNNSDEEGTFIRLNDSSYNNFNDSTALLNTYSTPANSYEIFAEVAWENEILDITGGVNFDWRWAQGKDGGAYGYSVSVDPFDKTKEGYPYVILPEPLERSVTYITSSAFLQLQKKLPLLSGLILTAGVRGDFGNADNITYQHFSPRVSAAQQFTDALTLKLNYGTALSAPGLKEMGLNNETASQNPTMPYSLVSLEAETFQTIEASFSFHPAYKTPRHIYTISAEVSGFYNNSKNRIEAAKAYSVDQLDSVNIFRNSNDTIHSSGIEVALKAKSEYGLGGFANYSYAISYDQENREVIDIPLHRVQAGIDWMWEKTGLFVAVIGRSITGYTTGDKENPFPASNFLDANLGWRSKCGLGIEMQVKNILNGEYYYPANTQPGILLPARSFTFTLTGTI